MIEDGLEERPFLLDPTAGVRCTYGELRRRVASGAVERTPLRQPRGFAEACLLLAEALALGKQLTFNDADPGAIALAGPGDGEVNRVPTAPRGSLASVSDLLVRARSGTTFRLALFTSGSTGLPKKVVHRLEGLTRMLRVSGKHRDDVWGCAYNLTHIAGVQVFLQAFFNANPLVNLFQLSREEALSVLIECGVTHLSATPSFYRLMLPADRPMPWVRAIALGGERSEPLLMARLAEAFPNARIRNYYASTEAGTVLAAPGELFEIPDAMRGVVRLRHARLELHTSLLGEFTASDSVTDGWYATGDVVEIASEEPLRFRFIGHDRDWINVGGNKVDPAEVEDALLGAPGVREARVFGRRNSVVGQLLCAELVTGPKPDEAALRAHLGARMQAFKVPRLFSYVDRLERTRTGKLKRE